MAGANRRPRPRAEDDDGYATFLGIGSLHGVADPDEDPPQPAGIWLPEHRSGSRFGGWQRKPFAFALPRPIGFRRP